MFTFTTLVIVAAVALLIGFVIGLLVGRKNPRIADTAATLANDAKSAGNAAASKFAPNATPPSTGPPKT